MRWCRLWFILVVFVALGGCGGDLEDLDEGVALTLPGEEDNNPTLVGGTVTTDRPEVGALIVNGGIFCTATLAINQRVILSAGHCLMSGAQFQLRRGSQTYRFNVIAQTRWGSTPGANDVLLGRLERAVPTSLAYAMRVATSTPANGTPMVLMGFGCTHRAAPLCGGPVPGIDSQKRRIATTWGQSRVSCQGDSGGPVFVRGELAGVISGYWCGTGRDIFGVLPPLRARLLQQAAAWR